MEAIRAASLRKKLGAIALIAAPGLIFVGDLVEPTVDWEDSGAVLDMVAAETARFNIAQFLWFFGMLALIPGIVVAADLFRRSRPGMSLAATILAPLVPLMIMGFIMFGLAIEAFVAQEANRAEMVALYDRVEESSLAFLPFILMLVGYVGILILSIGLWRSKATPAWIPAVLVVAFVMTWVAPQNSAAVSLSINAALWIAFGAIGIKILSRDQQPREEVVLPTEPPRTLAEV